MNKYFDIPADDGTVIDLVKDKLHELDLFHNQEDLTDFLTHIVIRNPKDILILGFSIMEVFPAYHMWRHMFDVALVTNTLAKTCGANQKVLMIASLLHDYGHSLGKKPDKENINCAIINAGILMKKYNVKLSEEECLYVLNLINVTEYPFVHEVTTIEQKIIRDADLTMSLMPLDYDVRLQAEMRHKFPEIVITRDEMKKFALSCEIYTDYTKEALANGNIIPA